MYVVIENTPGYLPDNDDPGTFEKLEDAVAYLSEEVERYCDHLDEVDEPYEVSTIEEGTWAFVTQTDRPHDLGRVFEVVPLEDVDHHILA